jgi:hypothetical protein
MIFRAGQLSSVRVPTVAEEAVRDLCRARVDMVIDRARHRLRKLLLRHGRVWRDGTNWTLEHEAWTAAQRFDDPALTATFSHYRATQPDREGCGHEANADVNAAENILAAGPAATARGGTSRSKGPDEARTQPVAA